jgi:DNA primase
MQVEELLTKHNVNYRPQGKDLVTLCFNPEHDDTTPGSFRIDKITGAFNCFACGYKGNVFKQFEVKGNALLIAREKLKRKISKKRFENAGYDMPENTIPFVQDWRGISKDTFRLFGAFKHADPQFIGRVVFPIRNIAGKIVGFIGRHETANFDPKYNIVPAGQPLPLYPIVKPIQGRVILVEGIFDMLNLHDKGLTNVVCAFGTKLVNKDKLVLLKVQGVTGIDLFFDNDKAGQDAMQEIKTLAESIGFAVNLITAKVSDPGELTASQVLRLGETLYGQSGINRDQTIENKVR